MDRHLEDRIVQHLRDETELLAYWQKTVAGCDHCKAIAGEITPFLSATAQLVKEADGK